MTYHTKGRKTLIHTQNIPFFDRLRYLSAISTFILLLIASSGFAQQADTMVYQLSGLVVNERTNEPVPYAIVRVNRSRRGIVANGEGFYSIPVVESDTVHFNSIGYVRTSLLMKEYLAQYKGNKKSPYLYAINYMKEDSVVLPTVYLFPYDTPEKLKAAMLAMNVPTRGAEVFASRNMDPAVLDTYIETLPVDAGERVMVGQQLYYKQYRQQNIAPVMPIFDPVAVYSLLKYINDKAKKEREEDLNYWEKN